MANTTNTNASDSTKNTSSLTINISGTNMMVSGATSKQIVIEKVGVIADTPKVQNDLSTPTSGTADMDNLYFFEDEVFRIGRKGRVIFGMIIETCETYDEEDYDDVVKRGEVRVAWYPSGKEDVLPESVVGLADRTLMPGDVVRRLVPGKDTQRGYCREIKMRADVKVLGTKYVIKNVATERLRLISNWQRDGAVCLDSWVGSTKDIEERAVLRSTYGARIEVPSRLFYAFDDLKRKCISGVFDPVVIYPGNVVVGRLTSMDNIKLLTPNIPVRTNKKGKLMSGKFTIESVTTDSVFVHWQCKALSENTDVNAIQQPCSKITGEALKKLKCLNLFESCMLQISDRNHLTFSTNDIFMKKSEWYKEQGIKFKSLLSEQQKEENQNLLTHAGSGCNNSNHDFHKKPKRRFYSEISNKSKKTSKIEKFEPNSSGASSSSATISPKKVTTKTTDTEWISVDDEQDPNDDEEFCDTLALISEESSSSTTTTTRSTNSSPSNRATKNIKRRPTKKAKLHFKKSFIPSLKSTFLPKDGDELVTETLLVYSNVSVVWQDGTVEDNIPSTQLYPIHHLDNHEFFPGDFVISTKEEPDISYRDYGVIQIVDHQGRTARVKWFVTYASADEPKPTYKGETEISVYDLKDHPDFQYRPGTMVIRVANFIGEDATCTAGQIIDNYPEGLVKVWWVDGHVSMCWPQDLFEVGQYDQNDWGNESEDSWETESENSEVGGGNLSPKLNMSESHILANIERARVALARLEEIFQISPNLQNTEVMRKLLKCYKGCRHLDRLLNTNFFHEDNFAGLIERVRKGGTQTISERAQDRKNRLFCDTQVITLNTKQDEIVVSPKQDETPKNSSSKTLLSMSSTPFKNATANPNNDAVFENPKSHVIINNINSTENMNFPKAENYMSIQINLDASNKSSLDSSLQLENNLKHASYLMEKNKLLVSVIHNIEKAFEKTSQLKGAKSDDSGNYSRTENGDGSSNSYASTSDLTNVDANSSQIKVNDDQKSLSCCSIEINDDATPELMCIRLCILLKEQLVKCINDIRERYYKEDSLSLSEVFDFEIPEDDDETMETSKDLNDILDNIKIIKSLNFEKSTKANVPENIPNNLPTSANSCNESKTATSHTLISPPASITSLVINATENFQVLSNAPKTHKYHLTINHPHNPQRYYKAVQREHRVLKNSLPPGVWVRVFEDRMDLISVMMAGPKNTPYEAGLFFFDIQLGHEYPKGPPLCHYISYCTDRLNPNLYEDGKVCVSLLGTWTGRDTEVWGPDSTILQVIVSIQGLILVAEPYFNEAGYEKQRETQQGKENSRMYNEMVIIKLVQATTKLLQHPPKIFSNEIIEHFKLNGHAMYDRIKGWAELSQQINNLNGALASEDPSKSPTKSYMLPEFPLIPASRGFCLTLAGLLDTFKAKIDSLSNLSTTE